MGCFLCQDKIGVLNQSLCLKKQAKICELNRILHCQVAIQTLEESLKEEQLAPGTHSV